MAPDGGTVLAVIPARGGSKRTPRKNVRTFRGMPLVLWSMDAAGRTPYIDMRVISTEDEEIKSLAKAYQHRVIDRPVELATDDASNEDVLRHALSIYPRDWVVLLQPTSPLRTAQDIAACIERAMLGDGCITYNEETHQKNGAVYVARASWIAKHDFSHLGLLKMNMPAERSLDIDYPEQFE